MCRSGAVASLNDCVLWNLVPVLESLGKGDRARRGRGSLHAENMYGSLTDWHFNQ
jgi:hypothetical protein